MPIIKDSYHSQKMIAKMRLKWKDSFHSTVALNPYKIEENDIRDLILDWLIQLPDCDVWMNETHGVYHTKLKKHLKINHRHYRTGVPDIVGSYKGIALYIEVKRPKTLQQDAGSPSDNQIEFVKRAIRNNTIAFFAYGIYDVKEQLAEFARALGLQNENFNF